MKAVIKTQGQQYTVTEGDILFVDRYRESEPGDEITIKDVLMVDEGESARFGTPKVEGAAVTVVIRENKRGKKLTIYKKKRRKGYERRQGHRQEISVIEIKSIKK